MGTASSPTTLTNYPVLISVTDSSLKTLANGGRVRNTNGYDIVFRGLDTTTCGGPSACTFAHEIEKYDGTTGQLVAWVNVPALKAQTNTADTTFNILFGNRAISTSTAQPTSTWDSNFTAVWHLSQDPTGTAPQMTRRDLQRERRHGDQRHDGYRSDRLGRDDGRRRQHHRRRTRGPR